MANKRKVDGAGGDDDDEEGGGPSGGLKGPLSSFGSKVAHL